MNHKINAFLDEVCLHINCRAVHKDIREELGEHIAELNKENITDGYDEEKALDLAISAMGSTDEIGTKLNYQHKPQTEWSLLILATLISTIGAAVMFLSSRFTDGPVFSFSRYIMFIVIGISTMTALYYFDYTKLKKMSISIYVSGILLIVVTMLFGIQMNGAKKWLSIGLFTISTPEFASLLFVIAFAGLLEKCRGKSAANIISLIVAGIFSVCLFVFMPSTPTALVMITAYAVVLTTAVMRNHFSGDKKIQLMSLFAGGTATAILLIYKVIANPFILKRLTMFFTRGKTESLGMDYQQHMANVWLSLSNWFGKADSAYQGSHTYMGMPDATGEYVLINVIATLGWVAGIVLMALIGIFIVRMFITTRKIKNNYGFYLSLSACTILSTQFIINILMNFNLFPLMGVNMPFVSYGSTNYIVSMALVGIILSVWRRNNLMSYKDDAVISSSEKGIVSYSDGRLTIDLKAWRQ